MDLGYACRGEPATQLSDFEQIVERLACAVDLGRCGLALDGRSRRVERAGVARVLRRDARRNRLHALEPAAWIERRALRAGVQVGPAACAAALGPNLAGDDIAALRAAHHLAKPGHVDRAGTVLRDPACTGGCGRHSRGTR